MSPLATDPLAVWLLAVLDDETRGLADVEGNGRWDCIATGVLQLGGVDDLDGLALMPRGAANHCEQFDPARMRAEVAAKRVLVDAYAGIAGHPDRYCDAMLNYHFHLLRIVVQTIAQPYADRPGFQARWRR